MRIVTALAAAAAAMAMPVAAARADRAADRRSERSAERIAVGVSAPWGWFGGDFGASLSLGLAEHHAIRANVARYATDPLLEAFGAAVLDGDIPYRGGQLTDVGVGWVWYPRRRWSGPLLEAGALRRDRDAHHRDGGPELATRSTTYAARAMIGWSWPLYRRVYVAIAIGAAAGRESGTETTVPEIPGEMPIARSIARLRIDGDAYFRIGVTFGR